MHFSYAKPEKNSTGPFGISSLRMYSSLSLVQEEIFSELAYIGKVLGAHGFVNISCIQREDGKRFYFEADMRPNVWVNAPQYLGEDPAQRIKEWFVSKKKLTYPVPSPLVYPIQLRIPYFLRMNIFELLLNRYGVWFFIPRDDAWLVCKIMLHMIASKFTKGHLFHVIKQIIPKKYHPWLRSMRLKAEGVYQTFQGKKSVKTQS